MGGSSKGAKQQKKAENVFCKEIYERSSQLKFFSATFSCKIVKFYPKGFVIFKSIELLVLY